MATKAKCTKNKEKVTLSDWAYKILPHTGGKSLLEATIEIKYPKQQNGHYSFRTYTDTVFIDTVIPAYDLEVVKEELFAGLLTKIKRFNLIKI